MYKQLLKLLFQQKRRDFTWKDFFVSLYGYIMLAIFIGGMYFGSDGKIVEMLDFNLANYVLVTLAIFLFADLLSKIVMKKEVTVMDDYLRTRPISSRSWDAFLMTNNLLDFWTWCVPIAVAFFALILLSLPMALLAILTSLSASMVNAMALTCYRRADAWWLRLPMIVVMALFLMGSLVYGIFTACFPSPALQMWTYIVLNLIAIGTLYLYLTNMHCYDEHAAKTKRVRQLNAASRFALDWAGLWRTKRMRQSVIIIVVIMVLDAYLLLGIDDAEKRWACDFIVLFLVCGPSLLQAQWTFGIEANFFHGLWTKPVSVHQLLTNKFFFFAILNVAAALLLLPAVCLGWMGAGKLMSTLLFTIGVINLISMPTCLFSQRLDLFSSAFFNYQGASMKINLYAIVCVVPMILFIVGYGLLPETTCDIIFSALGIVGIAVHPWAIRTFANAFIARRHERFEAYMQ